MPSEQTDRPRLDELVTEGRSPGAADYEQLTTSELVEVVNREDALVPAAVAAAGDQLAVAIDAIVEKLRDGGRLVYVGAGTSGRLAELDASECESTFSTEEGRVVALVAGAGLGTAAERDTVEDDARAGADAVRGIDVSGLDAVVGVSASGRTPFVLGGLEAATQAGALTACVVSVPDSELARIALHEIAVVVGPEVISGSTRLKAGTAQKLVLNSISTISMIRLGKTYGDLMVDVAPTNEKLRARARRAVELATGAPGDDVEHALEAAGGSAKVAIVSLLAGIDAETARKRLDGGGGSVRRALR
ncbi:MAG TPA: N-acetylmuramic acid 6-phosphate etherase [Gaiellaceae bacterium]|nr:N-acetylmuramic acid 6-phosphate etherase [Gaiellaceae bacterium]